MANRLPWLLVALQILLEAPAAAAAAAADNKSKVLVMAVAVAAVLAPLSATAAKKERQFKLAKRNAIVGPEATLADWT